MVMHLQVDDVSKLRLAGEIAAYHAELSSRINALNDVVDRIQTGWRGAAGQEYDQLQRGVNQHLAKIKGKLAELEQAVRMSVRGFSAEEQQRIADIRRVTASSEPAAHPVGNTSAILHM
ncbi:WXG100 family type VII secretion target [Streptomyces bambusae]|uniref:WXG100 family type VII secretion target n=1 Tax=Streptomyces bambusae TaxID=1550616 RepID=UPI001CFF7D89|nr:WXG100 family type VII secretion target [Streptomyces bambusae]MCB5169961.1 WXG100 family type VII secretion target [Streptomyces bambusae]